MMKPGDRVLIRRRAMAPLGPFTVLREQDDPETPFVEWLLENDKGEELGPIAENQLIPETT